MTLEGPVRSSWFNSEVVTKFGQESEKSFWNAQWRGEMMYREKYPRLFSITNNKEATVVDMNGGNGGDKRLGFNWRQKLFV